MTWPVGFLFTPQQLQGSVKYSSGVRLGNWREDDALDDLRLMDYVEAKEKGSLTLTAKREMRAPQIAPRTLSTASSDGLVRNGDLLQLTHLSGAVIAANMGQQLKELDEAGVLHSVTGSSNAVPIARNSLRITSFAGAEGDPVVYGQDVCFIYDAGGVGVLASARPATSHLGWGLGLVLETLPLSPTLPPTPPSTPIRPLTLSSRGLRRRTWAASLWPSKMSTCSWYKRARRPPTTARGESQQ